MPALLRERAGPCHDRSERGNSEGECRVKLIIPGLGGVYDRLSDYSWPLIRFAAGAMLVPHGWAKLFDGGLAGTAEFIAKVTFGGSVIFGLGAF